MFYANLDPTGYGTVTVLYGQKVIMMIAILNIDRRQRTRHPRHQQYTVPRTV